METDKSITTDSHNSHVEDSIYPEDKSGGWGNLTGQPISPGEVRPQTPGLSLGELDPLLDSHTPKKPV